MDARVKVVITFSMNKCPNCNSIEDLKNHYKNFPDELFDAFELANDAEVFIKLEEER